MLLQLGMGSAVETLCGQAYGAERHETYGAERHEMLGRDESGNLNC